MEKVLKAIVALTLGALIGTSIACTKPTGDDGEIVVTPPPSPPIKMPDPNPMTPSTTTTATTETNSETTEEPEETNPVDAVPTGTASVVLINVHDDGKGHITHEYQVVNSDTQLVQRVRVIDENGYTVQNIYAWYADHNLFEIPENWTFEVEIREYTQLIHRGVTIRYVNTQSIDIAELDRAMDYAGEYWVNQYITVLEYIDGNNGYATQTTAGQEMLIGTGSSSYGWNTRVLLHENGHNLDFSSDIFRPLEDVYDAMEGVFELFGYPYVEFKAEIFAQYYVMQIEIPAYIQDILDSIFG